MPTQSSGRRTVQVRIEGRVQGVGYRAWVERKARQHGIAGWVRNRRDGTVEAVFSGRSDDVDEMLRCCALGPHSSRVEKIETAETGDEHASFEIRPTL